MAAAARLAVSATDVMTTIPRNRRPESSRLPPTGLRPPGLQCQPPDDADHDSAESPPRDRRGRRRRAAVARLAMPAAGWCRSRFRGIAAPRSPRPPPTGMRSPVYHASCGRYRPRFREIAGGPIDLSIRNRLSMPSRRARETPTRGSWWATASGWGRAATVTRIGGSAPARTLPSSAHAPAVLRQALSRLPSAQQPTASRACTRSPGRDALQAPSLPDRGRPRFRGIVTPAAEGPAVAGLAVPAAQTMPTTIRFRGIADPRSSGLPPTILRPDGAWP
jgi:hypothetical protein